MKSNKNLVLIGMMGSGKTTIGKLIAKKLSLEFVDIDNKIEMDQQKSINEIFKEYGEDFFRKIEEKTTIKFLNSNNKIISLGGGGFLNKNIQSLVLNNNISFWLNWKISTLINRIIKSKKRPLAINLNEKQLKDLILERSETYKKANFIIDCEKLKKNEIVNNIYKIYEKI